MIALCKSLLPATFLTWFVCLFIGSSGSRGGLLEIHRLPVQEAMATGMPLFWSWPLFLIGTALAWVLYIMME